VIVSVHIEKAPSDDFGRDFFLWAHVINFLILKDP